MRSKDIVFADRHVQDLEKRGNIGRQRRLKATLGKLRGFAGEPLYFDRLTVRQLRDFETHCLVKLGNRQSTVATNLSDVRAIINKAAITFCLPSTRPASGSVIWR